MIFLHELGHFVAARIFHVKVNEFAIGMGPAIFKKQKGDTQYSLRILPFGGFCAMEGEDEESSDESAFGRKPVWQRMIILCSGAFMNFVSGLLILVILMLPVSQYTTTEIAGFSEGFPYSGENMLMENDRILKINGSSIYTFSDISMFLGLDSDKPYDILVRRDGEKLKIENLPLAPQEYMTEVETEEGTKVVPIVRYGIEFKPKEAGLFDKLKLAWYNAIDFVRLVRISVVQLFSGDAGLSDLSGPIGITNMLTETAKTSMYNMWMFVSLIAINLAVLNLMPLPALDGGRLVFLLIEMIRGKPINPKYEGVVHLIGLALFMFLMVYVGYNDIARLISNR